jgi:hypothetical protein
MRPYEAKIEVFHDCPYSHLTKRYPEVMIVLWCNQRNHVIEVSSDSPETLEAVERTFAGNSPIAQIMRQGAKLSMIFRECCCDESTPSISTMMDSTYCWYIPPVAFYGGWEHYRVVSWQKENITNLVKTIESKGGTVNLKSIHPLGEHEPWPEQLLSSTNILSGLTRKQIEALVEAYQLGYFDVPAKIDSEGMARRSGLSRSTFGEHLRKAEYRVLSNIFPILKMVSKDFEIEK